MLRTVRRSHKAANAPHTATGVLSSTLNGSDQLSYSAERIRNTKIIEQRKIAHGGTPSRASFHGLLLRFQTASHLLPARPVEAKEKLDGAIELAMEAITEGRDAVQGLRASTVERNDLAIAIRTAGDEPSTHAGALKPPTFSVAVEGQTRDLHPIVRDEIYKIATEALRNALRHAQAGRVEVDIRSDDDEFRLRVRDDGQGIDAAVLANQGLEGHYGLRGMPERAALIGGKLAVWSEIGAGTEVELRIPANTVYAISQRRSWWSPVA
jgi:signal transduction histidine kinase